MIKQLRNRFIRIATLSVAAVMLLLTVILNVANYFSTDADLRQTLDLIYENQGTIPVTGKPEDGMLPPQDTQERPTEPFDRLPPEGEQKRSGGPFTAETPFSTRFFVLRYTDDGTLTQAELDKIASVSEEDTAQYLAAALENGEGYGHYGDYRVLVAHLGENRNMAIFLDCYRELRSVRTVLLWSLVADVGCTLLVFLLVVLLSRRAIDPVVRSAERQKQFITDAGHELKTPITVIATSLNVLEMETGKQKWIDKAQAQTEKLTELVNSLVTLSRMDEETSPLKSEPFAVSEAVSETAESFRDFAATKGHELTAEIAENLTYCGDEYAVRQLVSILLDNAVKYAVPNTPIAVSLEKTRKGVILRTKNHCDPALADETGKLFDRFYRADPSRNAESGGFGIGLSIARGIAEGHRGTIGAKCVGDVIEFTVELR